MASSVVIRSFLDKVIGPVATVLGTEEALCDQGDIVLCGLEYGPAFAPCVTNWSRGIRKQVLLCRWKFWVCPAFPLPVTKPRSCVTRESP